MSSVTEYQPILDFWFGAGATDAESIEQKSALWWGGNSALDGEIKERFGILREDAVCGRLNDWVDMPRGRLALIILIDQFSRNILRNDARAFAHDALARTWCVEGIENAVDRRLRPIECVFLYLPLEHSESMADQDRAVALFTVLLDGAAETQREAFANFLDFARRHRDIIARFGRFPHRNRVLGRASTPAEQAFLQQPGSSFA
jgi:uncharacterized protein (DUF924 family)